MADAAVRRFAGRDLAGREALGLMREAAGQPEARLRRLLAEDLPAMMVYGTGPHGRPTSLAAIVLTESFARLLAGQPHVASTSLPPEPTPCATKAS